MPLYKSGLESDSFIDTGLTIVDDVDSSKKVQFDVANIATSTTRTLNIPNANNEIAFSDSTREIPHHINKVASANVRNSHDAAITTFSHAAYTKKKTITLTNGLIGNWRVLFDILSTNGIATVVGRVYRNGVALGSQQTTTSATYVTKSEDLTQNCSPGDTIELWAYGLASAAASIRNFRIAYDDSANVAVASSNSTP